jgi:anti-sigma regulatory factor (Ser/Thr protein kinase)
VTRLDHGSGISIAIDDSSQIGEARRSASGVAATAGLNEVDAGKFAIIASEAAANISKHASRGEIILRAVAAPGARAVELIAIDSGPGIPDVDRALRDGFSTAGSGGTGLGAMARLASTFDIFTSPGVGTVLSARIEGERAVARPRHRFELGVVRVPKRGESECGDDWGMVADDAGRAMLTVADGLGHGLLAAEASRRAVEVAGEHAAEQPGSVVLAVHQALRPTRGAAVAVAELGAAGRSVRFAGLGNISAAIVGPGPSDSKSLVSHNGIAGHEMRKIQEFSYDWPVDALFVMHSDGLSARWDLSRYPGLARRHPSVVAGVLHRDFSRGRDDALVVVVRAT